MENRIYMLYDSRASFDDTDDAIVLFSTDNKDEAIKAQKKDFPSSILYSYVEENGYLIDEKQEFS